MSDHLPDGRKKVGSMDDMPRTWKTKEELASEYPKEETKYKHLRKLFADKFDEAMGDDVCDQIIRAVLKDLEKDKRYRDHRTEMFFLSPNNLKAYDVYIRIGSITEKTTYEKEGFV